MIRFIISITLLLSSFTFYGQNQANNWALGNYQLDFNSANVQVKFEFAEYLNRGLGVISDENGEVLMYSDGYSIWNKNHQLMPNGAEVLSSTASTSTQETIIIPAPADPSKYYIFTVDPFNGQESAGLYYSVVDLSLENGLGDVSTKGVRILENTTNKISATFHENNQDIWLLTHEHDTNKYYSFLITSEGISDSPVVTEIGNAHGFITGQLKFSPDGKKIAVVSGDFDYSVETDLDIFDFDNSTGILSNSISFKMPGSGYSEGIDFSSDSKKLYVAPSGSGLYQFDLSFPTQEEIQQSRTLIHNETFNSFKQLQLAPDGKIYITKGGGGGGTEYLGVVSNLNDEAEKVVVNENGLYLSGGDSFVNYTPNFIQNYFFKTSFYYQGNCQNEPIQFEITNTTQIESVEWDFGEGSTSTELNPEFVYNEAGSYTVELSAHYQNHSDVITKDITINPFPELDFDQDSTILCSGSTLSVEDIYNTYQWQNEDSTASTILSESGYYTLEVTNEFGCKSKDSVYVEVIDLPIINIADTLYFNDNDSILVEPGNFDSYTWSTGENSATLEITETGWYSLIVTDESGCQSSKSFFVSNTEEANENDPKWIRLNPIPTTLSANDIGFVNEGTGFIVNNNELLKTDDLGNTWSKFMDISSGNKIAFKNKIGYIIGSNGTIYKSTYNAGGWNKLNTSFNGNLNSITLLHQDSILITSENKLLKSFDGGQNWEILDVDGVTVEDSYFINHLVGHVACTEGTILKTVDGGESWYETETSNTFPSDFFRITFANENIGFATKEHSDVLKTTDGGETWNELSHYADAGFAIQFLDENNGIIAGELGAIRKTTDGGESWSWIGFDGRKSGNDIYGIHFFDENIGFATGQKGRIIRTFDGGNSWENYSLTYNEISQIDIISEDTVYMLSKSEIYRSVDKGLNWTNLGMTGHNQQTRKIDFVNNNVGYAIGGGAIGTSGYSGTVFKTIDGGNTWSRAHEEFYVMSGNLYSIDFINEELGFVSGGLHENVVLKTIDGGVTWSTVESISFGKIQFLNEDIGYARNEDNYYNRIYKTIDGGESWDMTFEIDQEINSFHFVNDSVGYFVSDDGIAFKTTDGANSWQELEIPSGWFNDIKFYSENYGFIVGEAGTAYKTLDGGLNWDVVEEISGTNHIDFIEEIVYAYGTKGDIFKSSITISDQINFEPLQTSGIRNSKATIKSSILSSLNTTKVYLEYGFSDSEFETEILVDEFSSNSLEELSIFLSDLEEDTTYYCRFKVRFEEKEAYSDITSFTTWAYEDMISIEDITVTSTNDESAEFIFYINSYLDSINVYADYGIESSNYSNDSLISVYTAAISDELSFKIDNLSPSTEYFLRIRVKDGDKNTFGNEISFSTIAVLSNIEPEKDFMIFPNPTKNIIRLDNIQNLDEYYILDLKGKKIEVDTSNKNYIDLSALPAGIYLIILKYGNKQSTEKIIKY